MWSDKALRRLAALALLAAIATYSAPVVGEIISSTVSRVLPTAVADGTNAKVRLGRYGEQYIIPITRGAYALSDEGQYFHAQTATPGTAFTLTGAAQSAWVATTPTFTVKNNDAEAAKRLYLDFVRINITGIGTAGTRIEGQVIVDNVTRYSSGGTALTVYNTNRDSGTTTVAAQIFGGAITATAATDPRYICRFSLKTAIAVAGDSYIVNFGVVDTNGITAAAPPGASCPPAILGGGDTFLLYTWQPAQTAAPTGEVSAGWWER